MQKTEPDCLIRFGVFELDLRAGEVAGPASSDLAGRAGKVREVVTREELRAKLWPADTVVDFDDGLNAALKRHVG
jgi:hypothetical protein